MTNTAPARAHRLTDSSVRRNVHARPVPLIIHLHGLRRRSQSGSALIAVFWMIAILGMVVYAGARALDEDARQARLLRGRIYAKRMALAGMELARHPQLPADDPLLEHVTPAGAGFSVKIVAEEARLNINTLAAGGDKVLLPRLFSSWGLTPEAAAALTDALKDWVDADDHSSLNGAERRDYERRGLTGLPFNRPFKEVEEMLWVRGMEAVNQARPDWREWFTVYGDGRVDVNDARPELVALLANVPLERVTPLLALRAGRDGARGTQDDVRLTSVPQVAQLLGIYQPLIVEELTRWIQFTGPIRRIESTGTMGAVRRRFVLITQHQQALWRGEVPPHGEGA